MMADNSSGGKMILISGIICAALLALKSGACDLSGACGIGCVFGGAAAGGGNSVEMVKLLDTAAFEGWLCCLHVVVW